MDGFLNIYKEKGWTSNDVVQKLRGILRTKKVGHGGTLDPEVTGVLPVAVGKATRLLEYMDASGKIYEGAVTLGFSTETEDAHGKLVETKKVLAESISEAEVDDAMRAFFGRIEQTPPMYSAVKINGKKLYEYARAGQTIERPSREVEIKEFVRTSPLNFHDDCLSFTFRVACSKGTYVRTLAVDLADKLGYPGHMSELSRTMANGLLIENAKTLKEVEAIRDNGDLESLFMPLSVAVSEMAQLSLNDLQYEDVSHGKALSLEGVNYAESENVALFYHSDLIAIYQNQENILKAKKVLI